MKTIKCKNCKITFKPRTRLHKFCGSWKNKIGCSYLNRNHMLDGRKKRKIHPIEDSPYRSRKKFYRVKILERDGYKCCLCKLKNENSFFFDIDHINGNNRDNRMENLQTLCPNCHRLKTFSNGDNLKGDI